MQLSDLIVATVVAGAGLANLYGCYKVIRSDEPVIRKMLQCLFIFLLPVLGLLIVLQLHNKKIMTTAQSSLRSSETDTVVGIQGESQYD